MYHSCSERLSRSDRKVQRPSVAEVGAEDQRIRRSGLQQRNAKEMETQELTLARMGLSPFDRLAYARLRRGTLLAR